MRTFHDSAGMEWSVDLPFREMLRIKQASGIDVFTPWKKVDGDQTLYAVLSDQLDKFWELLWFVIEPQAIAASISPKIFGERMADDLIHEAHFAFFMEWASFFRRLQRPDVAMALETTAKTRQTALTMIQNKMSPIQKLMDEKSPALTDLMDKELNRHFGNLEASLASALSNTSGES